MNHPFQTTHGLKLVETKEIHKAFSDSPSCKAKDSKADSKAKPKPAAPKVAAALSSMVTPSQAIGSLECAADTGAGRHLVSHEALQEQGYITVPSFPSLPMTPMSNSFFQQAVVSRNRPTPLGSKTKMEFEVMPSISFWIHAQW